MAVSFVVIAMAGRARASAARVESETGVVRAGALRHALFLSIPNTVFVCL